MDASDARVTTPIFTPKQLAIVADMPVSTIYSWTRETPSRPALIHRVEPVRRGMPTIPLIGAAEALVIRPLRRNGMAMAEIAAAVTFLRKEGGQFALANPEVLHDGVVALRRKEGEVTTLRHGQGVLLDVVVEQLRPFRLAPDGFVAALRPGEIPGTEIDPRLSSGRLRFTATGVPVFAVAGMLEAGDSPEQVASEFGIELELVRAVTAADPSWLAEIA